MSFDAFRLAPTTAAVRQDNNAKARVVRLFVYHPPMSVHLLFVKATTTVDRERSVVLVCVEEPVSRTPIVPKVRFV